MIRKCRQADFDTIYEIINDAAQAYKGIIPADRWRQPYMSREELQNEIEDGIVFWGLETYGGLSGVMGIQDKQDVTLIRNAGIIGGTATGNWVPSEWTSDDYQNHQLGSHTP